MLELGVGVNAGREVFMQNGSVLTPSVQVGYRYDVIGDNVESTSRFTGGGASFKTQGADPAQSTFNIGTGVTWEMDDQWNFSGNYNYAFKSDYDAHSAVLKAEYKF